MKRIVSIYNNNGLIASKKIKSEKEAQKFIKSVIPVIKIEDKINQGWKIFTT